MHFYERNRIMATKKITIIDCTLRDGGYYNDWDFSTQLAQSYLQAADQAGIDVIEIGFRFFPKDKFRGAFAYSTDEFLRTLKLPKRAKIAVMVNADELVKHDLGPVAAIDLLFKPASQSPVSMVRVASHVSEVSLTSTALTRLKELGYEVGLNMMQVSRFSVEDLQKKVSEIATWGAVDVLYFADSLGNMNVNQVSSCVKAIAAEWSGPIGIHAHDNMGEALANTLSAADCGATWLDATMLGMGRGAGNAKMEFLLCEMQDRGYQHYNPDALLTLVMEDFRALHDQYKWGANLLYYMSARDDIHPTYVQTMHNDLGYDLPHVLGALKILKDMEGHSFSQDDLGKAIAGKPSNGTGAWNASDWLKGRDVLLLGAGDSTEKYAAALAETIANNNLAVLCLNISPALTDDLITAFVACHPTRILADMDGYSDLSLPLIFPVSTLHDLVHERLPQIDHLDFGLKVEEHVFEVRENGCTIPSLIAAAYALAIATGAGAKRILLAGFDGFDATDYRQAEMVEVLELYQNAPGAVPLLAITPTSFPVPQSSLFAPDL